MRDTLKDNIQADLLMFNSACGHWKMKSIKISLMLADALAKTQKGLVFPGLVQEFSSLVVDTITEPFSLPGVQEPSRY